MHFAHGQLPAAYQQYIGRKIIFLLFLLLALCATLVISISLGAAQIPLWSVARSLIGLETTTKIHTIIWHIRLPQALASVVAGAGLAAAGTAMQSILRNPLGSPFTLGISHAAAFGAALAVMILGGGMMTSTATNAIEITNPWLTTGSAFVFSVGASALIVAIARFRGATPEMMILTGVALGAFFTAGTMLLQFFADDVQLAAMIFWTFGDTARANWRELGYLSLVVAAISSFFLASSWHYNAIDAGDETAQGLGIRVKRVRMIGMLLSSVLTAVIISFLGVIGFIGLAVPHMIRRLIGSDHRFLLPGAILGGAALLLAADTVARLILSPHVLPVSVLTAFLGAPVFLLLILQGGKR